MTENNCSQCTGSGAGKADGLSKQTEANQFLKQNSMKQYFIGTLAVILAIAASAFTIVEKTKSADELYTFAYMGSDYAPAHVSDAANWSYVSGSDLCNGVNTKACRIRVSEAFVNNPSTSPDLDASINIQTANSSTGVAYVSGTADGTAVISNKSN